MNHFTIKNILHWIKRKFPACNSDIWNGE